ncbi:MAG: hypothetical protein ACOVQG_05295 [Crocinitomicaceae bacterium]
MEKKEISVFKWYLINISIWFFLTILFFYLIPLLVAQDHQIAIDFFNFKMSSLQEKNQIIHTPFVIYLLVGSILLIFGLYTAFGRYSDEGNFPLGSKIILISLNLLFILLFKDEKNNLILDVPMFFGFWWVQILIRIAIFSASVIFVPIANLFFEARYKRN